MTQAESKAAVLAGVQQEQLEAGERRRSVVLLLLGLAAAILAFWPGVPHLMTGAAFSVSAAPVEGGTGGNVVLVGYNGSQKFFVWAPPGSVVRWDVAFCNVADGDVSAVVRVVEVPNGVRRFLFYINETRFGWDGANYTEWRALFRPKACVPGRLEIVVDGRGARNAVYLVKMEVTSLLPS
ncbi:MAG: hypothetical protein JHC20_07130 [Pyrobaculum sp.]|nr:hypothetical protein [Pyrobaculum sp.]